jgi:HPt (histidine-containing phosphotransfer) domain-containing protein
MNVSEMAENLGLEEEEILELVELFVETGTSELDKLQLAIEAGDAEKALRSAHSLKGASANLGLMEFSETAKEIEEKAHNDQLEGTLESARTLKEKMGIIADSVKQ